MLFPLSFWYLLSVVLSCKGNVLRDFMIAQPPVVPHDAKQCTIEVLRRDFAFSFGDAEVVQLAPPNDCGPVGSWAAITLNFTVTSNGTQFDRLGIFTFQNVEIWRTSTFEPVKGDGIIWTYIKDVSQYMPLFSVPGTFILQLDNLIETDLDGIYSTTLEATFYESSSAHPPAKKADFIIPISTLSNSTGNDASVPPAFSLNVTVPNNTVAVFAEIFASGNGQEEDWFFNVPDEFSSGVPSNITSAHDSFREVRLLIDGQVAGVVFPYITVFTGGFVPSMWRPIGSYGSVDLPTYFLDVSPFVPLLTDGLPHNFTLDVVSAESNHSINPNWFVSGLLQVIVDNSSLPTTGNITIYTADDFAITSVTGSATSFGHVDAVVSASRTIHIEADILSGSGQLTHVVWIQDLNFTNSQTYRNNALVQTLKQTSFGKSWSTHNGVFALSDVFSYPFSSNFTYLDETLQNWTATIDHSYKRSLLPNSLRIATNINNHQTTSGFEQLGTTHDANIGNGTNSNSFSYIDDDGNSYTRIVDVSNTNFNNTITFGLDEVGGSLSH